MGRWIKRLLILAVIGGAGFSIVHRRRRSRAAPAGGAAPESTWPPFEPSKPTVVDWVLPADDGSCPDGYPVKANDNSKIFHVPTGRFYERTKAERCYAAAEAAERDGYRRAKS